MYRFKGNFFNGKRNGNGTLIIEEYKPPKSIK